MKKVYNYKKIINRINELDSMRDEKGCFTGTDDELDILTNMCCYRRETLPYALCLDFKTNVTHAETYFPYKGCRVRIETDYLVLDGIPYTAETEEIDGQSYTCYYNYKEVLVLKPIFKDGKERRFILECNDHSCCGCYYVKEEITEKLAA